MAKRDINAAHLLNVICPGCHGHRIVRIWDWKKRKSDYCGSCERRVRVGLDPSSEPSEKGTQLHNIWCGMRQRCGHKKGGHAVDLKHYADRGIEVCQEWRGSFSAFKAWAVANGYALGLMIDRKDNDLGYQPDNCRWVTVTESNRNKRTVMDRETVELIRSAAASGIMQRELSRQYGVSEGTVSLLVNGKTWQ